MRGTTIERFSVGTVIVRILLFREWEWNSIERDIVNSQDEIRSLFFRLAYVSAFNKLRRLEYKGYLFRTWSCRLMRLFSREPRSSRGRKSLSLLSCSRTRKVDDSLKLLQAACLRFESRLRQVCCSNARLLPRMIWPERGLWEQLTEASFHATTFNNSVLRLIPAPTSFENTIVRKLTRPDSHENLTATCAQPVDHFIVTHQTYANLSRRID